jgi:hypothetical protein
MGIFGGVGVFYYVVDKHDVREIITAAAITWAVKQPRLTHAMIIHRETVSPEAGATA